MKKVLIIGTGAWATALANVLMTNKHFVAMYGIDKDALRSLAKRVNPKCFGKTKLVRKPNLLTNKLKFAFKHKYDFILLVTPSEYIPSTTKQLKRYISNKTILVNCAKGLDPKTHTPLSNAIKKIIKNVKLVTLIGPGFASEVMKKSPTVVNVVSDNKDIALEAEKLFTNKYFVAKYCKGELNAQYMSSLKNVMAITHGMLNGLKQSVNTISACFSLAFKECVNILKAKTGNIDGVFNVSGIGDFFLTCRYPESRNYRFGLAIAKLGGKKALKQNKMTVEGLPTLENIYALVKKQKLNCPMICCLYEIIFKNKSPKDFVDKVLKIA